MKKYKIDCFQSKESGFTQVDLMIADEVYSGRSQCLEEDKYSRFTGGYIAELKAWIKYYKAQLKKYKNKKDIINNLYTNYKYKTPPYNQYPTSIFFESELNEVEYHIKRIETRIETLKNHLEIYYKDKND